MKQYQAFTKRFLLLLTPWIASSVLAASPSQAATLALSEGVVEFTRFSQSPSTVDTNVDTNTVINNDLVNALANAEATFILAPPTAFNSSFNIALGKGTNYLGQAESEATVIGNFDVDAGTPFSFDFTAGLNVATSIDNPPPIGVREDATASGDISFVLLDTANDSVLDFFSLVGNVTSEDDSDFIGFQKSENVTLSNPIKTSDFKGNEESATAFVQGSLQRSFAKKTNLTLIEVKRNNAIVTARTPEPSSILALLSCCGVIGVVLKSRRKETVLGCSLKR
ncbi:hypothetical protein [Scytonema sp. PCC 10023]|uniref:hypothetical protein n=1 Tax=Scytonema sp. PCC 10023 TaxID=1680591 RepID=UPI0039C5F378